MKEISDSESIQVFKDLHEHILTRGLKPEYMRLENEASPDFQRYTKAKGIEFQLASTRNAFPQCGRTYNKHNQVPLHHRDLLNRPIIPHENWYRLI